MLKFALLKSLVLGAMLLWVPVTRHSYLERPAVTLARYEAIANAIASTVVRAHGSAFEGLLLASIGGYESEFRADIASCKRHSGKPAASWTVFQVSTHRAWACESYAHAATVALFRVRESFAVCAALRPDLRKEDGLSFYATGKCQTSWFARSRWERAESYFISNP